MGVVDEAFAQLRTLAGAMRTAELNEDGQEKKLRTLAGAMRTCADDAGKMWADLSLRTLAGAMRTWPDWSKPLTNP